MLFAEPGTESVHKVATAPKQGTEQKKNTNEDTHIHVTVDNTHFDQSRSQLTILDLIQNKPAPIERESNQSFNPSTVGPKHTTR